MRTLVLSGLVALGLSLLIPGSAVASGSCGNDYSGSTACGVGSPGSYQGAIQANNEQDYYVFFAHGGTNLAATLTDNEDPGCSLDSSTSSCATGDMLLYDSQGNEITASSYQGPNASPVNGVNVSASIHQVLDTTGTYYLVVEGDLGADAMGNPTALPYTLGVGASPGVHWPPVATTVCSYVKRRVRRHHRWVWTKVRQCRTVYQ